MKTTTCKCGGSITTDRCFTDGFLIDCMRCDRCGEVFYTPDQLKLIIKLREANGEIEGKRKIVKVGSSIAALLPKKVEAYGIREGLIDNVRILSSNSLEIKFSKDIV